MSESTAPGPSSGNHGDVNSRGVGASIALIFMSPVVLLFGVFVAYAGAVKCGNTPPDQTCQAYSGWGYRAAVVSPAVLGVVSLLTRRRWSVAPFVCWVIAIVTVPVLISSYIG
ncbi:hypothetical protein ABIB25_004174 [Nakamurella sp. UYEF19]|uniref:hypothetical protein n=1 Tax=Nakamurella sp. UYEF19 TaxID=1756392 RepID=UPI0033994B6B